MMLVQRTLNDNPSTSATSLRSSPSVFERSVHLLRMLRSQSKWRFPQILRLFPLFHSQTRLLNHCLVTTWPLWTWGHEYCLVSRTKTSVRLKEMK